MIFVIFNGPAGSGKTTAARELSMEMRRRGYRVSQDSFAAPMKHFVATLFGTKYEAFNKEKPVAELQGRSVRQFLIDLSESYIKLNYGQDFYGRMLLHRALRHPDKPDVVIVDDSGFEDERDGVGTDGVYVVQIYRPGKDFTNDSRGYLKNPWRVFTNDGDALQLTTSITWDLANEVDQLIRRDKHSDSA